MAEGPAAGQRLDRDLVTRAHALGEALTALRSPRVRAIAVALFVTYAYFVGRPAWNQNSRFALTRALVEDRSPVIDFAHATTGDKSKRGEHFYSDKAPGLSALATVPYALFYLVRRGSSGPLPGVEVVPLDPLDLAAERAPPPDRMAAGDRLHYNRAWRVAAYLCRVFTVVPLALLGLAALFLLAYALARERHACGRAQALAAWVTITYALATPAFAYATAFYGHRPAADLLMIAGAGIFFLAQPGQPARRFWPHAALIASALGLAVCVEYTAAPVVLLLCAWAALRGGFAFALRVSVLGLPFAAALAGYHAWAFGNPFKTGYDFVYLETFAAGMRVQYGIHAPELEPALQLLFGSYRGLFALSPVLLLAVWGLVALPTFASGLTFGGGSHATHESRDALELTLLAGLVFAYYWLLNAGYYMWDGGAAIGPRHMLPAVPWLCLGLLPAWARLPRATFALCMLSGVFALLCTYASPEAPTWSHPIWSYALHEFANFGAPSSSSATNLGRFLGLPGPTSLIPLLLVWFSVVPRDQHSLVRSPNKS